MTNNPRRILIVTVYLAAALVYFAADSGRVPDAMATGGAFPSTKHGGGTVDSIKFDGVDRSIGTLGAFYYDDPEAGKYAPGECAHCHEPHASFSGTEPLPNSGGDGGPDKYLLMKEYGTSANYAELCLYCHSNMMGGGGSGTGFWDFFKGSAVYQDSSHYNSGSFKWPGDANLANVAGNIFPRRDRSGAPSGNTGSCLNCHTPHGVMGNFDGGTAPASGNYTVTSAANTGVVVERQTIAREEALCLNCHDGSPANTNIKAEVDKYLATAGSGHPVRQQNYFGRHNLSGLDDNAATTSNNEVGSQVLYGWFTAGSSHSECTDCHNPHVAQGRGTGMPAPWEGGAYQWSKGSNNPSGVFNPNRYDSSTASSSSPVKLGSVNIGVWGVGVNTGTGAITNSDKIQSLTTSNRVYNLCFKCHSAWAWGAATGTNSAIIAPTTNSTLAKAWGDASIMSNYPLTDVAAEFKTSNYSYHPVFAIGKNRPETAATPVRNPNWCAQDTSGTTGTYSSVASSCWSKAGVRADLINQVEIGVQLEQTLSQTFVPPWLHISLITCIDCHEDNNETTPRGPHGSDRPFILRMVDRNISYDICTSASAAENSACNGTTTINYSNLDAINDKIFCYNCHRADVYTVAASWATAPTIRSGSGDITTGLGRQPHPIHGSTNSGFTNEDGDAGGPPRGISCLGCHGGAAAVGAVAGPASCTTALCKLGNIHGNSYNTAGDAKNNRLIGAGANWDSWTRGTTATAGTCTRSTQATVAGWSFCSQHGGASSSFDDAANYNYVD